MFSKLSSNAREGFVVVGLVVGAYAAASAIGHISTELSRVFENNAETAAKQYVDPAPTSAEGQTEVKVADGKTVRLGFTP